MHAAEVPLLSVENLSKTYGEGARKVEALRDVTLRIRKGETVSVTGPSGSGKSTLLHVLGCLDAPTSGRYVLDGADVSTLPDSEASRLRNKSIGFIFQTFNLIPQLTVLQNVMLPFRFVDGDGSEALPRAREALDHVGLLPRMTHRANELSGGEMQRVAIARAIATSPLLLLADEPTGNLDSRSSASILDLVVELTSRGVTLIMVTHDPDVASRCRRHLHLSDGRLVSDSGGEP